MQHELDFQLYGAIAATRAVLPAMREAGSGTLLYTTGAGSIDPVPQIGNINAAAAALRNWVINLHKELAGTGIQAAHVAIDVSVNTPAFPGAPTAPAEQIARVYWELHAANRDDAERITTTDTPWAAVAHHPTDPRLHRLTGLLPWALIEQRIIARIGAGATDGECCRMRTDALRRGRGFHDLREWSQNRWRRPSRRTRRVGRSS